MEHRLSPATAEPPTFHHPEIQALYEYGMRIDRAILRNILNLPKDTLVEDLHAVVYDSINRCNWYKENREWNEETHEFPLHALFLLTQVNSEKSLGVVLDIMRQDEDYFDLFFGDHLHETLWEVLVLLGYDRLTELVRYLEEPNRYLYARAQISVVLEQIALHNPGRREEIVNWYKDIFEFFITHSDDDAIADTELLGLMVCESISLQAEELLPLIEKLYEKNALDPFIPGPFKNVKRDMSKTDYAKSQKREVFNFFDRYDHIVSTWAMYREEEDDYEGDDGVEDIDDGPDFDEKFYQRPAGYPTQPIVRTEPKVGRNDPCPCGSGKKHKKCCGG